MVTKAPETEARAVPQARAKPKAKAAPFAKARAKVKAQAMNKSEESRTFVFAGLEDVRGFLQRQRRFDRCGGVASEYLKPRPAAPQRGRLGLPKR